MNVENGKIKFIQTFYSWKWFKIFKIIVKRMLKMEK